MQAIRFSPSLEMKHGQQLAFRGASMQHFGQRLMKSGWKVEPEWSFVRGMRVACRPKVLRFPSHGKRFSVSASCNFSATIAILNFFFFFHKTYDFQVALSISFGLLWETPLELRSCI